MNRFRHVDALRLFEGQRVSRLPANIQRRARVRLQRVVAAAALSDLRVPPSHRLEALRGHREGNTASELTTSGECALFGRSKAQWISRSPTTTAEI